jgi:hypothetical protein
MNTEKTRMELAGEIALQIQSNNPDEERLRLEQQWGQVWNTKELAIDFDVKGFMAPFIVVTRKSDDKRGSLMFQHHPRFYFNWDEAD